MITRVARSRRPSLWRRIIGSVLMLSLLGSRSPALPEEGPFTVPTLCPPEVTANGWGNTFYVEHIGSAESAYIPWTVSGYRRLVGTPPLPVGLGEYLPLPTRTISMGSTYDWIGGRVAMTCLQVTIPGIVTFPVYDHSDVAEGYAVLVALPGGSSGGGGAGESEEWRDSGECYDVYLVWRDNETGLIVDEEYLGSTCDAFI